MDTKRMKNIQNNRFLKLSLKKNKIDDTKNKMNRSSDVIVLDESFDRIRSEFINCKPQKIYSPIIINDSCELSMDDLPKVIVPEKKPSKVGNVSFNGSLQDTSPSEQKRPSIGGWSPAQNILCATPRNEAVPSTPKDRMNESFEQCSIKKIQLSQKKLLNDLYGETWKSIPTLFKTIKHNYANFNSVSKKLQFDDDEKENVRHNLKEIKSLYLTESETKKRAELLLDSEKKSKRKLYTEKIPCTPEIPKSIKRNVISTTKKKTVNKALSVTELVETMKKDIDVLTEKVNNFAVTPVVENVKRLSFVGSLSDNVPSWRCHPEAIQYRDNFKNLREQLTRRLYVEFNKGVFDDALDADMPLLWDTKLRSTAGKEKMVDTLTVEKQFIKWFVDSTPTATSHTFEILVRILSTTTNRRIKTAKGDRIRTSSIKLSTKVLDVPDRLRDTLIHEMCHAATWLIDGELKAGHGPLWKKWATRALRVYPELGEISRCHDMAIHFKYTYKCTKCGYSVQRHSKSLDITKKCCGYCRGTFEIIVNKKTKDGAVVSTPARKGNTNDFARFVKENYALKKEGKTHAQVMKILGEEFSAMKRNKESSVDSS